LDFIVIPFVFLFGLAVGSFLNVCIYRMPIDKSVVNPPSACPQCGTPIKWYDNIPVLSYILLRGRCRSCKAGISVRYLIVELATALLFVLFYTAGVSRGGIPLAALYLALTGALIVCTGIDFEHYIIPDAITLPGTAIAVAACAIFPGMIGAQTHWGGALLSVAGAAAGSGILFAVAKTAEFILKKEAMGMGDVKLLAMIGACIGWKLTLMTIFFSSMIGSSVGIALMLTGRAKMQSAIPFGPYISAGALLSVLIGDPLIRWYFSLMF